MTPHEIVSKLDQFSGIEAAPICWLVHNGNEGHENYCRSCAETMAGDGDVVVGETPSECDSCYHCDKCGRVLDYSLTEHGVLSELDHFHQYPPTAPLKNGDAFHIARILEAVPDNPEAQRLAESAVQLIGGHAV